MSLPHIRFDESTMICAFARSFSSYRSSCCCSLRRILFGWAWFHPSSYILRDPSGKPTCIKIGTSSSALAFAIAATLRKPFSQNTLLVYTTLTNTTIR